MLHIRLALALLVFCCGIGIGRAYAQAERLTLDDIIAKIEVRYAGPGFSARFAQTSVIKAMDIMDLAYGTLLIKRPNKMRWEYLEPEQQSIVTNGKTLWVYRPLDNQVMTGKAPEYFDNGKGASFLTDIRMIREKFHVTLIEDTHPQFHRLNMIPKQKEYDIAEIRLEISRQAFEIIRVITVNNYDDETIIELSQYQFGENPDDAQFEFQIPKGVDVLTIEE